MTSQIKENFKWVSKKFDDKPRYCRVPIFFGGERQIHIMQPYIDDGSDKIPTPKTVDEWWILANEYGQIVFSWEALDDFIDALKELKREQQETNKRKGEK